MRIVGVIMLMALYCVTYAQPGEFGQVYQRDFETVFRGEEEAPAIILFDIGKAEFKMTDRSFDIHFTRTTRIKINSKEAMSLGEVEVPFQFHRNRRESVTDIRAFTYVIEDGDIRRIPMGIDMVYEEDDNEFWKIKKFVLPKVAENTIIEYTYTIIKPSYSLPDWEFQHRIPTVYSSYEVSLIPFYEYSYRLQGANKFDYYNSGVSQGIPRRFASIEFQDMIHTYVMKNLPPFNDEAYITSKNDYIIKLDFQLAKIIQTTGNKVDILTTWEKLNESFLKHESFGKFLNQSGKYAKELVDQIPPGVDKAQWLIENIRERYTWNGQFRRYTESKAKDFAASRQGSSTEINLFLCAALIEAGYDAKPVLISTRNNGKIYTGYPFQDQFNSTVVLITTADGLILTDGTEKHIPYNTIPPLCINGQGLVVDKNGDRFINLSGFNHSKSIINFSLSPSPDSGVLEGHVFLQAFGYDAYYSKKELDEGEENYIASAEENGLHQISKLDLTGISDDKFEIRYEGKADLEKLGEQLLISPFLDAPMAENPLKNKSRKYPIDILYSNQKVYVSQLKIPEGYFPEDLPEPYQMEDGLMKLSYSCKVLGEHLVTQGEATFKKSIYETGEYVKLRAHITKMVELMNRQVILVKK